MLKVGDRVVVTEDREECAINGGAFAVGQSGVIVAISISKDHILSYASYYPPGKVRTDTRKVDINLDNGPKVWLFEFSVTSEEFEVDDEYVEWNNE